MKKYPVNEPLLSDADIEAVTSALTDGWISSEGPAVAKFEEKMAGTLQRSFGIAVANGTAAIDTIVEACGLSYGDEVIVPSFTIISTINALLRTEAKIRFADCSYNNYTCSEESIISKINENTKLIICAHIYCFPVDYSNLEKICQDKGIFLMEDAAELYGAKINDRIVGSFGDASIVSFYPNKYITTGEGGMIITDSPVLAEKFKKIRNLGFDPNKRFFHETIGYNFRMTNIQAALGLSQLENLRSNIQKKQQIGSWYYHNFQDEDSIFIPPPENIGVTNYYWVVPLHIPSPHDIFNFAQKLANVGVGTRPQFYPLNLQPVLQSYGHKIIDDCPASKRNYYSGLYLPNGLTLGEEDAREISNRIKTVAKDVGIIS